MATVKGHKKLFENLGDCLDRGIPLLDFFIENYGSTKALMKNEPTTKDYIHDYVLFCLTKSLKSIKASFSLITLGYSQDSLIILRTVYESYLTCSYVFRNPLKITEILHNKLGVALGAYSFVKNDRGKNIKGKLIDNETGEIIDFENLSLYALSANTEFPDDKGVHRQLYKYLSEFIHPNMICAGNYREDEGEKYSIHTVSNWSEPMWISAYLITILLQQILHFDIESKFEKHCKAVLKKNIRTLVNFSNEVLKYEQEDEFKVMFASIIKRLEGSI